MSESPKRMTQFTACSRSTFCGASEGRVGVVTLNRPERKNPLTFESYAELRDLFRALATPATCAPSCSPAPAATSAPAATCTRSSVRSRAWTPPGCCSFTRMTGRSGQGDARLPAADHRGGRRRVRRRGGDPCDGVGLPPGHAARARPRSCSRASASPAATWVPARCCRGSSARDAPRSCCTPAARCRPRKATPGDSSTDSLPAEELLRGGHCALRTEIATGPTFAHAMTKTDAARRNGTCRSMRPSTPRPRRRRICMQTEDFRRAYRAFVAKQKPAVRGQLNA